MEKEVSEQIIARLDRVDKSLDAMSTRLDGINKVLIAQAKTETEIVRLLENDSRHNRHIEILHQEIDSLKKHIGTIREKQSALGVLERLGWVFLTTLVATAAAAITWVKT